MPSLMAMMPSWLRGFWSKNSRTKALQVDSMTDMRDGRMSCCEAAADRSTTYKGQCSTLVPVVYVWFQQVQS
jgi:hypothetical protein